MNRGLEHYDVSLSTIAMVSYFWFGGAPREPLPGIDSYPNALRPTRNKKGVRPVRANHHMVPGSQFMRRDSLEDLLEDLFGAFTGEELKSPAVASS